MQSMRDPSRSSKYKYTGSKKSLQHHETAEILEGIVRNVPDLVESQRHGLQGWKVIESLDRDLRQSVIIQPQVT